MFIKAIILDGFKSYGRRTEIRGFDNEFNAITGLNGTGKSNILDSICFVLGITNLSQVRATSLQDLVYKSGQAGITQANVTLVFDNRDKDHCPVGFEDADEISVTRQVVVGGKNKYLINGRNVPNKRVQDLFCSVQLNINNPNFIIMQGRITKVLNMKPHEILSLVEEAAGTNIWQMKRDTSLKMIEKKDAKLKELNANITEEIQPKLEKLREERQKYIEYQNVCRDIEFLKRIHFSYLYLSVLKITDGNQIKTDEINALIEKHKDKIEKNEQKTQELQGQIADLTKKLQQNSEGELEAKEIQLSELIKENSALTGKKKALVNNIEAEKRKFNHLKRAIDDDQKLLQAKRAEQGNTDVNFKTMEEENEKLKADYEAARNRVEAITAGVSTTASGQSVTLQEQLMEAKQLVSTSTTKIQDCQGQMKHLTNLVKEKQNEKLSADTAYDSDRDLAKNLERDVAKLTQSLGRVKYQEGSLEDLENRRIAVTEEMQKIQRALDQKGAHRFEFQYRNPEPNFNCHRVKGRLCNLFSLSDMKYGLALQMCAGGSLYHVVTDTDVTSKMILQKGDLQTRTTMMPLNKISSRCMQPRTAKMAESVGGKGNIFPALSLINYDPALEQAMKYVFGNTFICKDIDVAKKVTFHREIMTRCVTLDGDVVDPSGSLTGGSRPKGGAVLLEVANIKKLKTEYNEKEIELRQIENQIQQLQGIAAEFRQLKQDLELRQHELKAVESRLANSTFQMHQSEIQEMKAKLASLEEELTEAKEVCQREKEKIKMLESQLSDSKGYRERQLKQAKKDLADIKAKYTESSNVWKKKKDGNDQINMEIEELIATVQTSSAQLESFEEKLKGMEADLENFSSSGNEMSEKIAELKAEVQAMQEHITSQDREIGAKTKQIDKMTKESEDLQVEIKKQESALGKAKRDGEDAKSRKADLEKKFPWILEDKEYFGAKNTKYDYSQEDPKAAEKKLHKMQEIKDRMSRTINEKAMMLLEREEADFKMVVKQRENVEKDKATILKTMKEVDQKKNEQVKKACQEVGNNFSNIFSSILPGAEAKLVPVDGNYLKGLAVNVGFNGLWKEGLAELSGGQRSLVALSLILAMLKFNPAPIYILDEVDAALDLSHTQNIGSMLKQHFKKSQFIIVSLKDGMFNNANVLFRTKFEDGMSGVVRTVNPKN
ncbi:structural maintenance of chromosomes protein 2 [Phlebotomus argentipes]|uniref:structural maintenance of chromosomes protein 2 n=1 Tax=Phlebotomus argentipes TaxID=94469 RepID=UPI002892E8F1|nr:structural maintenance of chromosomes protein 2 [Phlebotomus argentipes]